MCHPERPVLVNPCHEQSLSFRMMNATVFCNYHCEYDNFHDSTVGSRITIPSCHCNYWRLGNEPIELQRLQIWLTIGLVHLCYMGRGQSSDFVLEPRMSSSVSSSDKFAATARRTQDVGRISDRVYRAT